jgi:Cys-tRNA(Pro)/Cys-tRNA(Cys) deacylase
MTKTPATAALDDAGVGYTLHSYPHDPARAGQAGGYGLEAAQALGVEAERIFKTLVVDVDGRLVVCVVPVTTRVSLKSLAQAVGGRRAVLADPAAAARATGYIVGGISPLGQKRRLTTVLDETALLWATILVSAGRRGLDVELAPDDLLALTGGQTADVCA